MFYFLWIWWVCILQCVNYYKCDYSTYSYSSSCTSLFILLFIKSIVYCIEHLIWYHILFFICLFNFFLPIFIYILLCCVTYFALSIERTWPDLHFCIIEYVTNKRTYPNQKLWINAYVRAALKAWTSAFNFGNAKFIQIIYILDSLRVSIFS